MSEEQVEQHRPPLNSLATKIILFVFLSTFATALAVSWISIRSTHASLQGVVEHLYPLAVDHAALRAAPWLEAARLEVQGLERKFDLVEDSKALGISLADASADSLFLDGLVLYSENGSVRAKGGSLPMGVDLAALSAEFARRSAGLHAISLSDGSSALTVWASTARGDSAAGLLCFLNSDEIAALLEAELPDAASFLGIVDGTGRFLAGAGTDPPESVDLAALAADDEEPIRGYDVDRKHMIGTAKPLGVQDWHVAIQAPFDAAFEPMLAVVSRIFLIDLVIILVFSSLAYRVTAKVVRPIENLSESARRIAQGQTEIEIPELNTRDEIGLLTCTFNDMIQQLRRNQDEIETANRSLTDRNTRLQQLNEVLNQLSITDGLTKLHNHRFFQDHLTREIKRVNRTREPLSMLLIDIDDFKQLNDRFGHAAGDELLSRIALILNDAVRESDLLARYGGEEFVILASNTDIEGAYQLAEKVRTEIAESSFILDDSLRPKRVTVSIGVAVFLGNRKRFFQETDQALYSAKGAGKNCVVVHQNDDFDEAGESEDA
jgi:diguanylate cyclase (GGDEF)-like protein